MSDEINASLSRRGFLQGLAASLAYLSLFQSSFALRAFATTARPTIAKWLKQTNELAQAVSRHEITPVQWQSAMEKLLTQIDRGEFLNLIDFDHLMAKADLPNQGESFEKFSFGSAPGLPKEFKFYRNLAGFRKGRSIPPHGHDNLVSSFLVLRGELHGRHFDRLEMQPDHFIVRPTIDRTFRAGDFSTVSDDKNNIHWFNALTDRSFIFDFGIDHIQPHFRPVGWTDQAYEAWKKNADSGAAAKSSRIYMDIDRKEVAGDGTYKVHRLSHEDAYRLYG